VLPEDGPLAADLAAAGVDVRFHPIAVLRRELLSPRGLAATAANAGRDSAIGLGALARREGIALVHSNTSVVLSGAAAARRARVPHVWHVREIYTRFGRAWPVYRRVLGTAQALPCVSRATAAQFTGRDPTRVIADGLAVTPRRVPREQARAALGLDTDAPVIAVLGRISDWKGQDVLIRALAEAPLREPGTVGLIAGEVWPGAAARLTTVLELAHGLGVSDRVRLLGFRDDPETVYGAADVIAVPSTAPDPLPGAAIEAAAAGCAVIASAHGGLPEIIRDGETGRLVRPSDPRALATAARALIDDPTERERLGGTAAEDVARRFAPAHMVDALQELYDSTLAE
jgi:glycosyltransferase involved in cell wall biosynthesis